MIEPLPAPFGAAGWIWSDRERSNQFVLFRRVVDFGVPVDTVSVVVTASYHYELFLDGEFVNRGPVHGDPKWCSYDRITHRLDRRRSVVEVVALVHHSNGTYLHYLTPAPAGFVAAVSVVVDADDSAAAAAGGAVFVTDSSWLCREIDSWADEVPQKGWALGYCEEYDARKEPAGMNEMRFGTLDEQWHEASVLDDSVCAAWGGYTERITPCLARRRVTPERLTAFRAGPSSAADVFQTSALHDSEPLDPIGPAGAPCSPELIESLGGEATAFTFDLGAEYVGFYEVEVDAPSGTILEISGAELLQPGTTRPWVFRKGVSYTARFTTAEGRRRYRTFFWSGFRYLHVVLRGSPDARLLGAFCLERKAPLVAVEPPGVDVELSAIYDLCVRTLAVSAQELIGDCPTREQSPAWLDNMISAQAMWVVFDEPSYLEWYLEAYLRAPLDEYGLINGRYPATNGRWIDFCLLPLEAHRFYRRKRGRSYEPARLVARSIELSAWYEAQVDDRGLIDFDFDEFYAKGLRNFIDHPGLSMHDADHVRIDRRGTSCPLNTYYLLFLEELATVADEARLVTEASFARSRAAALRALLREVFFDGEVFHDCEKRRDGSPGQWLSDGTSWQTNSIALCAGLSTGEEARRVMRRMLDGYDFLCRPTPGLMYWFLAALCKVGLEADALELVKREWGKMIRGGATTSWETFLGNEKDSLCHPWGVVPVLLLHGELRPF